MSNQINLNGVKSSFSLPLQIITAVLLLMQLFFFGIVLYLVREFHFSFETITSIKGWIMLGVLIFFIGWNIIALIQRNRHINKATSTEEKEIIFKASTLVRFMTMNVLSVVALVFALIWNDIYFFMFFAFSFVWQIAMFPTKSKIALAVGYTDEEKTVKPKEEVTTTSEQAETKTEIDNPQQNTAL